MEGLWIWFLPLYNRLRSILQQGVIGEIKHISCQYGFVKKNETDTGFINSSGLVLPYSGYGLSYVAYS